jgi:hypothetical protein
VSPDPVIGSGEAASYRRLPPLEPSNGPSRHVPLPVLKGPTLEAVRMMRAVSIFLRSI